MAALLIFVGEGIGGTKRRISSFVNLIGLPFWYCTVMIRDVLKNNSYIYIH
jgi:hypothetical protein